MRFAPGLPPGWTRRPTTRKDNFYLPSPRNPHHSSSFRTLSRRLKFAVRRHRFNKNSLPITLMRARPAIKRCARLAAENWPPRSLPDKVLPGIPPWAWRLFNLDKMCEELTECTECAESCYVSTNGTELPIRFPGTWTGSRVVATCLQAQLEVRARERIGVGAAAGRMHRPDGKRVSIQTFLAMKFST